MSASLTSRVSLMARIGTLVFIVIYGLPFVYIGVTAIKPSVEIFRDSTSLVFTPDFSALQSVWNADLLRAAGNSAIIAFSTSAIVVVTATFAAYGLSRLRSPRLAEIMLTLLIILQMVPQANSVLPLYRILGALGLLGSLQGVIVATSALLLPFAILMLRPFFNAIPEDLIEAAEVDGASQWSIFLQVGAPLARNGIATVAILIWIISWGEFLYSISFLSKRPLMPLSARIAEQVQQYGTQWGPLMALALIATVPVLVVFLATQRLLTEGLTVGATKG